MGKLREHPRALTFDHTSVGVVGLHRKTSAGSCRAGAALKIAEDILRRPRVSACESRYRNAFLTLAEPDRLPRQKWCVFFHSSPLEEASRSSHFRSGAPLLDSASANVVSFALEWFLHEC